MTKRLKSAVMPDLTRPFSAELLGKAINAKRKDSQLTLADAAALCGVAKQTLLNLEHGQITVKLSSLLNVCQGLGLKLSILPWRNEEELNDEWQ